MSKNVAITDEFDSPQGLFRNYDAYDPIHRDRLWNQKHADIRSFASDEAWTVGTVGRQSDRNNWLGLSFTAQGGQTTTSTSIIHVGPQNIVQPVDVATGFDDSDFLSVALPAFPLANIDTAQSFIDFTSNETGDFTAGPTVSLALNTSTIALVAGDSEFRRPFSALVGIQRQAITGVRFRIRATTTTTFRCAAIRILGAKWSYTQLDTDTRLRVLKPTVAPNGSITRIYDWNLPTLFRAGSPPGAGDPKPINLSMGVMLYSGTKAQPNAVTLYFRENALDFTQMIDLEDKTMADLEGQPLPETTNTGYRVRTQKELDRLVQTDLEGDTQLQIERVPDPDLSSFIQATYLWYGNQSVIQLQDSEGNGYTFDEMDGLAANSWYVFIVDVDDNTMRARLYPIDGAGNLLIYQPIYDTGAIYDDFTFPRRRGRFGWSASLRDGDAKIEGLRVRRQVYAELLTQPFESLTPVDGCQLHTSATQPYEYFEDLFATDDPRETVALTRDLDRSTSGVSFRVFNPGLDTDQGVQTNLADFYDFDQMEISFDVWFPSQALEQGSTLRAYLFNDRGRTVELSMGEILGDRWQTVRIEPGHPTAQTGRYRFFLVQEGPAIPTTWWVDNLHITERVVSYYGRSVLEDPWGDARVDWVPFKNLHSRESSGVQFIQRGNYLQVKALGHRQESQIDSIRAVPMYSQLGRFVWEEDELYNPQRPFASFSYTPNNLTLTFNAMGSYDPDGDIINYQWNFGDGNTAVGPVVSYKYPRAGTYSPSLVVTDSQGLQAQTTQTIFVPVA
jgi:hypothetical protein